MASQYQTIQIPLANGLDQLTEERALQPPALAVAKDITFDEIGGIQTRLPLKSMGIQVFGGSTLSKPRQIVANGDELLLFTDTSLYTYNAATSSWVLKTEHPAIAIDEKQVFATTGDQIQCDRAELGNTVVYCWYDGTVPAAFGGPGGIYVAAIDKSTNSILMAPTAVASVNRARLIATTTKILLFYLDANSYNLYVTPLDPSDPATSLAAGNALIQAAGTVPPSPPPIYFDACKETGADAALLAFTRFGATTYEVARVPATIVGRTTATFSRVCNGPIAIASSPTATTIVVARANDAKVYGDVLTSSLTDSSVNHLLVNDASATMVSQVTAAFQLVQTAGQYRCYAFWSGNETNEITAGFALRSNWIDDSGATGSNTTTAVTLVHYLSVGSSAFAQGSHVYVYGVFSSGSGSSSPTSTGGAKLQNSYFLYREDGRLCGKAVATKAGGFEAPTNGNYLSTVGHLPGVQKVATNEYSWCAQQRRIVDLGDGTDQGYEARTPTDVTIAFDSNRARRCVRIGQTLYVTGHELLQWDGRDLVEVGFHVYPWALRVDGTITGGLVAGTYSWKDTFRYDNAKGERERSTTATVTDYTVPGSFPLLGPQGVSFDAASGICVTHKTRLDAPVVVETWRTKINPNEDDPFFLVSSRDPSTSLTSDPNRFNPNVPSSGFAVVADILSDDDIADHEQNAEVGTVLEDLSPPAAHIIKETQDRIFLADVAGDPDNVYYSKVRAEGAIAAFHDSLKFAVPPKGGKITAVDIQSETVVVFRERAAYVVPGEGFANDDTGSNFGPARIVSSDVGAESPDAVAKTDAGIVFHSPKGWYLLTQGWACQYIGGAVADYDDEPIVAVTVMATRFEVHVLTAYRRLVWHYVANQWSEWTQESALGATVWQGKYVSISDDTGAHGTLGGGHAPPVPLLSEHGPDVWVEQTAYPDDGSAGYGLDIESPWVKFNDLQGQARVRWLQVLGAWKTDHNLRVRFAKDYKHRDTPALITTAMHGRVLTTGRPWKAKWASVGASASYLVVIVVADASKSIEVRDDQCYDTGTLSWYACVGYVTALVKGAANQVKVSELEAAIIATSAIVTLVKSDDTPGKYIDIPTLDGQLLHGAFEDGIDWFDDKIIEITPTIVDGPLQERVSPSEQRCQAMKVRITAQGADGGPPSGEALKLTGLALDVAVTPGLNRRLPATQKH